MARFRALSAALDAALIAAAVDVPALVLLGALFVFAPDFPLSGLGLAASAATLGGFLMRDTTGGFSRKWLGFRIEKRDGSAPGLLRSVLRNVPTVIPGWNLYEAYQLWRRPDEARLMDRLLGLQVRVEA